MLVGTGSDVGKSVIATALCRIFLQDGYSPAPFKAQNMALNSYATPEGLEIGRAQAVQAEAARVPCHTDMNPLLLKPNSEHTTQVVLNGKPIGNRSAYDYFRKEGREELRHAVCEAFDRLAARYNPIVMEGAGSVSEINLRDSDLVNMPMARHANADVILVADIDRGGVFASTYGSIMLQTPEDKARIKGIIVNKFRGDLRLFESGRKMLEELCGVPVLGVVPMFKDIVIEEEDSVELEQKHRSLQQGKVNIAVVLLRHISNFTDFNVLERDERVNLFYTNNIKDFEKADIIIIPGQMLGQTISDPDGIEGSIPQLPGLGLLNISTVMTAEKTTKQVEFEFEGQKCKGYEIHQGKTKPSKSPLKGDLVRGEKSPFKGDLEGLIIQGNCIGTYIHGFLDNPSVIEFILKDKVEKAEATTQEGIEDFKNRQYDLLAEHVRKYVDIDKLYEIMVSPPALTHTPMLSTSDFPRREGVGAR